MKKEQFDKDLKKALKYTPADEYKRIWDYYEEQYRSRRAKRVPEEAIILGFGSPSNIIDNAKNSPDFQPRDEKQINKIKYTVAPIWLVLFIGWCLLSFALIASSVVVGVLATINIVKGFTYLGLVMLGLAFFLGSSGSILMTCTRYFKRIGIALFSKKKNKPSKIARLAGSIWLHRLTLVVSTLCILVAIGLVTTGLALADWDFSMLKIKK